MGWDRHKLLWDGTDKYAQWTTLQITYGKNCVAHYLLSRGYAYIRINK